MINKKNGMSKIALIIVIIIAVVVITAAVIGIVIAMNHGSDQPVEIYEEVVDIYTENIAFTEEIIEDSENEKLEPLDESLVEFRNDEYGVRFGYPIGMSLPEDYLDDDNFYHSTLKKSNSTKVIEFTVGQLDNLSARGEYINEKLSYLKEKAGNVTVSYGLLSNQMSVRFKYEMNGLKYYENLTIKNKTAYMLTYKADKDEYSDIEADKVFNSFVFVNSYRDYPITAERKIVIEGTTYELPIKVANIRDLNINPKYASEILKPNYFSLVSLYETKNIKYGAYVYNARASEAKVDTGYLIGIETDKFRGGDIEILGGIKIGTLYSEVTNMLGNPKNQHKTDSDTVVVNTYVINDATIELKYKSTDGKPVNDTTPVYGISIKFKR